MSAKIRDVLAFSLLALFLLMPSAQSVETLESQEDITLTIERGTAYEFPLMLGGVDESMELSIDGDIEDWAGFGSGTERKVTISAWQPYVIVKIDVPDDEDLGEYGGEILADGSVISELTVKVTLDLSSVMANEEVADLQDKVGALTDDVGELRTQVATLEHTVTQKVSEIQEYQKDLDALEKEKAALEKDHAELSENYEELQENYNEAASSNEELSAITGSMVGVYLPGSVAGGIILGVLTMVTIIRREQVKRSLKKKLKNAVGKSEQRDEFRYSFSK